MNLETLFDRAGSIKERDAELETELMTQFHSEYVNHYITRIERLESVKDFVRDDSYHDIRASHHIMYKLKVGENGETRLTSKDGNRGYEFLVEFDKYDPEYGIYYGCRGLILGGDQKEEIDNFLNEWKDSIMPGLCEALNNTFVTMDFSHRFLMTDNANNKTFWPFWIALGEDEDVVKVAARATSLVAKAYKRFLSGEGLAKGQVDEKTLEVETKFTFDAYHKVLKELEKERGIEARRKYECFIRSAEASKIIEKNDRYECCWKFPSLQNIDVAHLMDLLSNEIGLKNTDSARVGVPWKYFIPVFLSKEDKPFDSLKKSLNQHNERNDQLNDEHRAKAKSILAKLKLYK